MAETKCPCGLGATYEACCGRYVEGAEKAPTAEALMRSRYAAFTKKAVPYIVETHHSRTKSTISAEAIQGWCDRAEWLDFAVEETSGGAEGDEKGRVRFLARYKEKGVIVNHHEDAYFEKEAGVWRFVDGGTPPVKRAAPKVGRNDPCPCGSSKKWKKCCGAASAA